MLFVRTRLSYLRAFLESDKVHLLEVERLEKSGQKTHTALLVTALLDESTKAIESFQESFHFASFSSLQVSKALNSAPLREES